MNIIVDENGVHHYGPDTTNHMKRYDIENFLLGYFKPDDIYVFGKTGTEYHSDEYSDVTDNIINQTQWAGYNPITNSLVLGTAYAE